MVEETMRSRGISSRFFLLIWWNAAGSQFSGGWSDRMIIGEDVWVNAVVLE